MTGNAVKDEWTDEEWDALTHDEKRAEWARWTAEAEAKYPLPDWLRKKDMPADHPRAGDKGYWEEGYVNGWWCDDVKQLSFAGTCILSGFNVPEFDLWLASLRPDAIKCDLLKKRHEAFERLNFTGNVAGSHFQTSITLLASAKTLLPLAQRDVARQAGTKKPRKPAINEWIVSQLEVSANSTREQLWERAPEWITDAIGKDRFFKRASEARKIIASRK